ncbi:TSUP family transporter [Micromonospora sp. M12]
MPASAYRPVVLVVLVSVAVFVLLRPRLGWWRCRRGGPGAGGGGDRGGRGGHRPVRRADRPGTGTFLVVAFTALIGADFVHGSAMAKVVNAGTNLGALVVFGVTGHVWWLLGAAMAVCNIAGAVVGARMALRRGSGSCGWCCWWWCWRWSRSWATTSGCA